MELQSSLEKILQPANDICKDKSLKIDDLCVSA